MAPRLLTVAALAALPAAFAAYTLGVSVAHLATPMADAVVTWSGIVEASKGDWVAVCCDAPTGGYFWWYYTSGAPSGSLNVTLWGNGKSSGCDSIHLAYYDTANAVLGTSPSITVAPMIQQIHLSLTPVPTSVVVDFVSSGPGAAPACHYGTSAGALDNVARANTTRVSTIGNLSYAVLTGLASATRYYYACTDGAVTSETHSFVSRPAGPARVAVWADFGVDDGFGLDQIRADSEAGAFDVVVHAGVRGCCLRVCARRAFAARASPHPTHAPHHTRRHQITGRRRISRTISSRRIRPTAISS